MLGCTCFNSVNVDCLTFLPPVLLYLSVSEICLFDLRSHANFFDSGNKGRERFSSMANFHIGNSERIIDIIKSVLGLVSVTLLTIMFRKIP